MLLTIFSFVVALIIYCFIIAAFCLNTKYAEDCSLTLKVEKIIDSISAEKNYGGKIFFRNRYPVDLCETYLLITDKGCYIFYFIYLDLVKTSFTNEKTNENYIIWSD